MSTSAKKNHFSIFLDGEYRDDELKFYRELIEKSKSIAVDGGFRLFERLGMSPDIALGDFDGFPAAQLKSAGSYELIRFDSRKDKTDGELAVELAFTRGADEISLCGYAGGAETDHVLGNLLLLVRGSEMFSQRPGTISAVMPSERVWLLSDRELEITGMAGDWLSVVPLDERIRLSLEGCEYIAEKLEVARGSTRTMRNRLCAEKCLVKIEGAALVFWRKSRENPPGT